MFSSVIWMKYLKSTTFVDNKKLKRAVDSLESRGALERDCDKLKDNQQPHEVKQDQVPDSVPGMQHP